jgi:hypothetical protein
VKGETVETALATTEPDPDAEPRRLWARDVAALLAARIGKPVQPESITQYVWLTRTHIRDEGKARPGDIPLPAGRGRPPWRVSGALYPYWETVTFGPDGTPEEPILDWVAGRQVAGRPRADGQPRVRGGTPPKPRRHQPRAPSQPPGPSTVRCGSLGTTPLADSPDGVTCATCRRLTGLPPL